VTTKSLGLKKWKIKKKRLQNYISADSQTAGKASSLKVSKIVTTFT